MNLLNPASITLFHLCLQHLSSDAAFRIWSSALPAAFFPGQGWACWPYPRILVDVSYKAWLAQGPPQHLWRLKVWRLGSAPGAGVSWEGRHWTAQGLGWHAGHQPALPQAGRTLRTSSSLLHHWRRYCCCRCSRQACWPGTTSASQQQTLGWCAPAPLLSCGGQGWHGRGPEPCSIGSPGSGAGWWPEGSGYNSFFSLVGGEDKGVAGQICVPRPNKLGLLSPDLFFLNLLPSKLLGCFPTFSSPEETLPSWMLPFGSFQTFV